MKKLLLFVCAVVLCQLSFAANKWADHYPGGDEKLFYNQQTIEEIRARIDNYEWAKKLYRRLKEELADPEAENYVAIPGISPRSYQGRWTRDAALCYRIDGDETHLPQVVKNVVGYFMLDKPNKPRFSRDTTKLNRNFWEWGWYSVLNLTAYDLIKNHRLMRPYRDIMDLRIQEILEEGKRYYRRITRIGNTHFWGVTTMGLFGFMAGDQEAIDWAINGPKGLLQSIPRQWPLRSRTVALHHWLCRLLHDPFGRGSPQKQLSRRPLFLRSAQRRLDAPHVGGLPANGGA